MGDIIAEALGAGRVLDAARPPSLSYGTTVAVEESLEHACPNLDRVVEVLLRDELAVRVRPGQPELAESRGDRIRDDDAPAMTVDVTEDVVVDAFRLQLDPVEGGFERLDQLGVRGRECRG